VFYRQGAFINCIFCGGAHLFHYFVHFSRKLPDFFAFRDLLDVTPASYHRQNLFCCGFLKT